MEKKPCPLCNAPYPDPHHKGLGGRKFTTHRDQYFQRIILDQKVKCPHQDSGCEWVGPLLEIKDHTASCKQRPWVCLYCMLKTTYGTGTSEHPQKCPQRPVQCACSATVTFAKYEDHKKVCPVQVMPCEYSDMGCDVMILRKNYSNHLQEFLYQHHFQVSQMNLRISRELQSKWLKKDAKWQKKLEEKDAKINDLQKDITKLYSELSNMQKDIIRLQGELRDTTEADKQKLMDKLFQERDRELQVNRLLEQMQIRDEVICNLRERRDSALDTENAGSNVVMALTDVIKELKSKTNLHDIKKHLSQLEDILSAMTESESISSEGCPTSPVSNPPIDVSFVFKGELDNVLIKGLKRACGLAISGDMVYVVDTNGSHGVYIASDSNSVKPMIESASFSDIRIPDGKCWYPRCVAVDRYLNIILVDTSNRVLKFSPSGKLLAKAGSESSTGSPLGEFSLPMGIAIDSNDKIFVCDCSNHRVQVLDSDLKFVSSFGRKGSGLKEFKNPKDVSFDTQGNIYVADWGNCCVKVFSPDMAHLRDVGKKGGQNKVGDLRSPISICIDSNDNLYVADAELRKVLVYNSEGNFTTSFGAFRDPNGICVDLKGRVYVSDNGGGIRFIKSGTPGRVQVFI